MKIGAKQKRAWHWLRPQSPTEQLALGILSLSYLGVFAHACYYLAH